MNARIDWSQLIALRENGQRRAQERVAADRHAARAAAAETVRADMHLASQRAMREQHLHSLRDRVQQGRCDVAQLRESGEYVFVLDARVGLALHACHAAQERHAEAHRVLLASRQRLREADAELLAAKEMHLRETRAQARVQDARAEDASDESARQMWLVRQAHMPATARRA